MDPIQPNENKSLRKVLICKCNLSMDKITEIISRPPEFSKLLKVLLDDYYKNSGKQTIFGANKGTPDNISKMELIIKALTMYFNHILVNIHTNFISYALDIHIIYYSDTITNINIESTEKISKIQKIAKIVYGDSKYFQEDKITVKGISLTDAYNKLSDLPKFSEHLISMGIYMKTESKKFEVGNRIFMSYEKENIKYHEIKITHSFKGEDYFMVCGEYQSQKFTMSPKQKTILAVFKKGANEGINTPIEDEIEYIYMHYFYEDIQKYNSLYEVFVNLKRKYMNTVLEYLSPQK